VTSRASAEFEALDDRHRLGSEVLERSGSGRRDADEDDAAVEIEEDVALRLAEPDAIRALLAVFEEEQWRVWRSI